ncbi:hypothetical protein FGO68_gene1342 [Halteria grandinella]|uniref:Uncharacterized protein n=1 Tax=Halteria grandinella TaxID=5974 RepID=A0A8J8T7Q8_HALGN|nr:hypothetical protein FGO68_gene1342 [Halteria grandinella]
MCFISINLKLFVMNYESSDDIIQQRSSMLDCRVFQKAPSVQGSYPHKLTNDVENIQCTGIGVVYYSRFVQLREIQQEEAYSYYAP